MSDAKTYLETLMNTLGNDFHAVLAWNFQSAPECFRDLSDHGGDEDFVVVIPPGITNTYLHDRLHDNLNGMCESPSTHVVGTTFGEFLVLIYAHA